MNEKEYEAIQSCIGQLRQAGTLAGKLAQRCAAGAMGAELEEIRRLIFAQADVLLRLTSNTYATEVVGLTPLAAPVQGAGNPLPTPMCGPAGSPLGSPPSSTYMEIEKEGDHLL